MKFNIERFKSIVQAEIPCSGITLLVGGNNSGKSSILHAIQFGVSVAQTSQLQGATWGGDRISTSIGQNDLVYTPIKDVMSLGSNGKLKEAKTEAIEVRFEDGPISSTVSVRKGRNKNILLEITGQELGQQLRPIQTPFSALVTGLAGIPSEEKFQSNLVVRKAAAKGDSNSVFRNILWLLKSDPTKWAKFEAQLSRIYPSHKVLVDFSENLHESIVCDVEIDGIRYPVDTCGTGVLQAIQIFAYINLFEPKLLLLDEPDSHLHPNNQRRLAEELLLASRNGLKIIISTHSRQIVEGLIDDSSVIWMRSGKVAPIVENYEIRALLEIGALNAGERVHQPRYVFLTEDREKSLFRIFLESNGFDIRECEIVSYSGCTQLGTAIILINNLRRTFPGAKFCIHRDRDFQSDATLSDYCSRFLQMNVKVWIPTGNDIESTFCRREHLKESLNLDQARVDQIVESAFISRKDELIKKYVNTRMETGYKNKENPNAGEISIEAHRLITGATSVAVHGKILLMGIRDELKRSGISDNIIAVTPGLQTASMTDIFV